MSYDANGNLISDANKNISRITYNYLNLPSVITVTGKGTITYTYDAAGNKLKKVTIDNTATPTKTTTTLYLGGVVYENDMLQFIAQEEGRIRPVRDVNNNITGFVYDYFLKGHLGNVRMVLTEEQKTDAYPPASMETAQAATEEALYANLPQTRTAVSTVSGYPTDTYTNPNNNVAKVNGSGQKIGPSIILKVMAGDKFNIRVSSWYKKNGATPGSPNNIATDLIAGLIGSLTGAGGPVHGAVTSTQLQSSGAIPLSTTDFLNTQPAPGSTKPKAYLNWVLLDEQFKFVQSGSGAEQVGNDQEFKTFTKTNLPVTKNGYLYVYVSNETPNIDVFFDNLQVTHTRGPILEETHYYPFGLTMAGISSKAFGGVENKYKYNKGSELQNNEFSDGSGLELYATNFRSLDPQLGRFWQMDPLAQTLPSFSPYQFADDNPIFFNDPYGLMSDSSHPVVLAPVIITAQKKTDNTSAWRLGVEWLTGSGSRSHHFKDGDPFTKKLQEHEHIQDTRNTIIGLIKDGARGDIQGKNNYTLSGLSGVAKYVRDYSTLLTGGLTGNIAVTYLGSYGLKYEVVSIDEQSGTAQVHFSVSNTSTVESATHPPVVGYTQWWSNNIGKPLNNFFSSGPLSPTSQTVEWTETIQWKGNK